MNNIIPPTSPTTDNQSPQQPPQDQQQDQGIGYPTTLTPGGEKGLPVYEEPTDNSEAQQSPEAQTNPEAQRPQPTQPPVRDKNQDTLQQPAQTADNTPPKNVVDKTTNKEKLHKVGPKPDTITSLADKEEEEFIEKVEEHHKH